MPKPSREYVYGLNPAFEVIRAGKRRVMTAFINESIKDTNRIQKLLTLIERHNIALEYVDKGRVIDLSGSKEHQGVVLRCTPYPYISLEDMQDHPRVLLLDNVEDPHNVGAILRCAEIFGFQTVLLPRKGTPEVYPSVVKVSAGASEFLDIVKERSANQYFKHCVERGYKVVALDAAGRDSLPAIAAMNCERLLLVIGGENKAVGQFILNETDFTAAIPQGGRINSLNASVASGIAMYALAQGLHD